MHVSVQISKGTRMHICANISTNICTKTEAETGASRKLLQYSAVRRSGVEVLRPATERKIGKTKDILWSVSVISCLRGQGCMSKRISTDICRKAEAEMANSWLLHGTVLPGGQVQCRSPP